VKEGMSRAQDLEAQLAAQQAASKERQEAVEAEKAALEEQLVQALGQQQQLARALQAAQAAGKSLSQECGTVFFVPAIIMFAITATTIIAVAAPSPASI
jgi:hypothetical protein